MDESGLRWLMNLYGYDISQNVINGIRDVWQPQSLDCEEVQVTLQEILYDGVWLYTSSTMKPPASNDVIIVPKSAFINDFMAGGYSENLRDDPRTFLEAALEEEKDLLFVGVYPSEYSQADYYFLDHRQDAEPTSTLFSGAPVTLQDAQSTIHILITVERINPVTGESLGAHTYEYPIEIERVGMAAQQKYTSTRNDVPVNEIILIQTPLATYVMPSWESRTQKETIDFELTDTSGNYYPRGNPDDSHSYMIDVFPESFIIKFIDSHGELLVPPAKYFNDSRRESHD